MCLASDVPHRSAPRPSANSTKKGLHSRIGFPAHDQLVLRLRDGALFLIANGRPLPFGSTGQAANYVQSEVMQPPQIVVGRDPTLLQHFEEMFGACFQNGQIPTLSKALSSIAVSQRRSLAFRFSFTNSSMTVCQVRCRQTDRLPSNTPAPNAG